MNNEVKKSRKKALKVATETYRHDASALFFSCFASQMSVVLGVLKLIE